ncbi:unnamed protein product [Brassicogethes aeneus]|uniref:C2H2-type domain-containing protein n=1 Tax=Brassicogethes aeneus TaxID=1431903 RepID=A0A9P0AV10_BRAAE|nr:unnamed protein product [Brassicogethes aeneus]
MRDGKFAWVFKKAFYLLQHTNAQHGEKKQYMCMKCGRNFLSQEHLDAHTEENGTDELHKDRISSATVKAQDEKLKFKCTFCDRVFTQVCYLMQHTNAQHGEQKQFKCMKCGQNFASQELLDVHKERHSADKPHKCRVCPKQYHYRCDLKKHMLVHSKKPNPLVCTTCGRQFLRKDRFKHHRLSHEKKAAMYDKTRNLK